MRWIITVRAEQEDGSVIAEAERVEHDVALRANPAPVRAVQEDAFLAFKDVVKKLEKLDLQLLR